MIGNVMIKNKEMKKNLEKISIYRNWREKKERSNCCGPFTVMLL